MAVDPAGAETRDDTVVRRVFGYPGAGAAPRRGHGNPDMERQIAFDEVQRELRARLYPLSQRLRIYISPLPLLLGGVVLFFDPAPWRRGVIIAALTAAVVLSIGEEYLTARQDLKLRGALLVGATLQILVMLSTGGVMSPVLLPMLLVGFAVGTLLERSTSRRVLFFQLGSLWVAAVLELSGVAGPLLPLPFRQAGHASSPAYVAALVLVETIVMVVASHLGWRIQLTFGELLDRAITARDESLRLHHERLNELTQLSAEIAHELKNPLTSVKGLAGLLARRGVGDAAEPLSVLRREVDRMQTTLEEFLNFSRPLIPLNVQRIDLAELTGEVVTLHQGLLESRQLTVEVCGAPRPIVECDRRKVQQILVNLVQNAIDASPRGGRIDVAIQASADAYRVTIADQGPGPDASIAGRVFEAGVTSKEHGSGLGLNVARGLARQHGGEVTLDSTDDGCVAVFTLPDRPPSEAPGDPSSVVPSGAPS